MTIGEHLKVLETDDKLSPFDVGTYLNLAKSLRVGFELEYWFDDNQYDEVAERLKIAEALKVPNEKGKKKLKEISIGMNNLGEEIKTNIEVDAFKEHEDLAYLYDDGSVPFELVTTAYEPNVETIYHKLTKIYKTLFKVAKESFKENEEDGFYSVPEKRCGQHQTFAFEHQKSDFPEIVKRNIIQISRLFTPTTIYLFSAGHPDRFTRDFQFRQLNKPAYHISSTEKYRWVNIKSGKIEFRYPDGNMCSMLTAAISVFNRAVIEKAIKFSEFGVLFMKNSFYQTIKDFLFNFVEHNKADEKYAKENFNFALQFLSDELKYEEIVLLKALFVKPIWSIKMKNRYGYREWKKLDDKLYEQYKKAFEKRNKIEKELRRIVTTSICGSNKTTQTEKIMKELKGIDNKKLKRKINDCLYWDNKTKVYKMR